MFNIARRTRTVAPPGLIQVPIAPGIEAALVRLGERWKSSPERTAERIVILALTGWTPKYFELVDRLSRFVPGSDDPFRRTCLMLRHHFDKTEVELGEAVRECDRVAWLETLLDALRDKKEMNERALLGDLLADGAIEAAES